jgi:demethoxyubiquinone hydroxylase (CLK1/Coq7/Cat5 family)
MLLALEQGTCLDCWERRQVSLLHASVTITYAEAAMAVTVAVEEVIGEHYNSQLRDMIENGYTKEEQDVQLKNVQEFVKHEK